MGCTNPYADAYTCGGQIFNARTHMRIAYTWGGQICNAQTHTRIAYTCGGQICNARTHTRIAYTCGGQITKGQSHLLPREPKATPGSLWHPLRPLVIVKNAQNSHFLTF